MCIFDDDDDNIFFFFDVFQLWKRLWTLLDAPLDALNRYKSQKKNRFLRFLNVFQYFAYKPIIDSLNSTMPKIGIDLQFHLVSFSLRYDRYDAQLWSLDLSYYNNHGQIMDRSWIDHRYIDGSSMGHRWIIDRSSIDHRYYHIIFFV